MDLTEALNSFAYVVPLQQFIYKLDGKWNINNPVGREAIQHFLVSKGVDKEAMLAAFKAKAYTTIAAIDNVPNQPELFMDEDGLTRLNTWVPPMMTPEPGDWPRIERIIKHLCDGDERGTEWFCHWLAAKVQDPALVPKIAVVFCTEQGAGKGTLFRIVECMLGRENCANIDRAALESRFNARWADKLFILADEVMSNENVRDVSDRLKIYIDSPTIELEGKGVNQRSIRNRQAWIFATNDKISPVQVEKGDRRYTVFSNFEPLSPDYRQMLLGVFSHDNEHGFEPSFVKEIQAFWYDLLHMEVDRKLISRPFENDARKVLIEASRPAHEQFFEEVDREGIDSFIEDLLARGDWKLQKDRPTWDFGENGISTRVLHQIYSDYCKRTGRRPLAENKFGAAVKNHRPAWPARKNTTPDGRRVNCYIVKRTAKEGQ